MSLKPRLADAERGFFIGRVLVNQPQTKKDLSNMPRKSETSGFFVNKNRADATSDWDYQDKHNERRTAQTIEKKEIRGELPKVKSPKRRKETSASLKTFLLTYFPDIFYLDFSPIHLDVINKIEQTIEKGELYALAMPRGSGKTSICQCALVWAIVTGRAKCAVLCCASQSRADQLLKDVYALLSANEKLAQDYPKEVFPFYCTASTPRRLSSLTYDGAPLRATIKQGQIVFPAIPGSTSFESVLFGVGLTGSGLRGLAYTTSDGRKVRPDFCLVDDPQDNESANSPQQTLTRERLIKADLLGMAGAGKQLSCLITCTVIAKDDLADRLLNRSLNPEFHGQRYQLLSGLPKNLALWDEWNTLREDELRNDQNHDISNRFYLDNVDAMQEGATPCWNDRKDKQDKDALTYAMRLYYRDKDSFWSEYMNQPADANKDYSFTSLTAEKCSAKLNGLERCAVESDDRFITGFIDVHKRLLYYTLVAWKNDFSGNIIDYGVFPKQPGTNWTHKQPGISLTRYFEGQTLEDAISLGIGQLVGDLVGRDYTTADGTVINVQRILVDANWGQQTETVYTAIRKLRNPIVTPSHGVYIGAKSRPFGQGYQSNGDVCGINWRVPSKTNRVGTRYVLFDSNFWKSFFMRRLIAPKQTLSNIQIFGNEFKEHARLVNHFGAEFFTDVEARGGTRRVEEWELKPGRTDNHWFDCCVGCCVAASMCGLKLQTLPPKRDGRALLKRYHNEKEFLQNERYDY